MKTNYSPDWKLTPFSKVADFINGAAFKPSDWEKEGLPIIRIQNLNNIDAEFNYFNGDYDERYFVKDGDILLSWSASLGVYRWNRGNAILNQHIFNVKPKENIDPDYLFYIAHKAIDDLSRKVHGSTMKHFKKGELDIAKVPVPTLVEQRGIAEVLGTVDEAVRVQEQIIAEAELLKQGLMQRLLTEGIGHTEYKQTPIGRIPKTWVIKSLKEVSEFQSGKAFPSEDYSEQGIKLLRPGNLHKNGMVEWNDSNTIYLPKNYEETAREYLINKNEILMNLTAQSLEDQFLGRVCVTSSNDHSLLNQRIARITSKEVYIGFLFWVLKSTLFRRFVDRLPGGTKIKHIYPREIVKFKLPIPAIEEQKEISQKMFTSVSQIQIQKDELSHLIKLKQGLMQVLLSGERRVELREDGLHRI